MDEIITSAYQRIARDHDCSADNILETPELREAFLRQCREARPGASEHELLHHLMHLRKQGRLPRSRDLRRAGELP